MDRANTSSTTVFILSLSSDIGEELALHYLGRGARVLGTYRTRLSSRLARDPRVLAVQCDVATPQSRAVISQFLQRANAPWDIFISCVGQLAPVSPFFECEFEQWAESASVNSLGQLRALHAAHAYRRLGQTCHVVFFAGGGTNGPFPAYSAYCIGKIALIKMCELLDDENSDLNVFIVGTGWVRTKIHQQTLAAGAAAGQNQARTAEFMGSGAAGTQHGDIAAMIDWGVEQGRPATGGRNFSIVHDGWRAGGARLAEELKKDRDKYKLRRHRNT